MRILRTLVYWLSLSIFVTAAVFVRPQVIAAKKVVLKYAGFRGSIPVGELTNLAQTGETSQSLQFHLEAAQQDPEDGRQVLTQPIDANLITLDQALNSSVGNLLLDQIGQVVHPPTEQVSRQALRSVLVSSTGSDNQISLIEVLQNYPASNIEVEGDRSVQTYRRINILSSRLRTIEESLTRGL